MSTPPSNYTIIATIALLLILLYDISLRGKSDSSDRANALRHDHMFAPITNPNPPPPSVKASVNSSLQSNVTLERYSGANWSYAPLALGTWNWTGSVCAPNGVIGNEWKESCSDVKNKWACEHFGMPGNNDSKPWCGRYTDGVINTTEPITVEGLELVRQAVLADITQLGNEQPSCKEAAIFGRPIDRLSIYFDNKQDFHTRDCKRHSYFEKRAASTAAILSYHASIIGKIEGKRGILFTGDSMMRQQFEATVCMIRGGEGCIEHYYHSDALYLLYKNRDAHYILHNDDVKKSPSVYKALREWFPGYFEGAEHSGEYPTVGGDEPVLAILFLFDHKPNLYRQEQMRMANLSLQITSYMYWWDDGNDKIDDYMRAKDKQLNDNPQQTFVFVTQPWREEDGNAGLKEEVRVERNRRSFEWIINKKGPSEEASKCQGPCRRWLLDYGGILHANTNENIINRVDKTHYQCAWLEEYPRQLATIKQNQHNCRDPMNFAVIQWLLALLVRI